MSSALVRIPAVARFTTLAMAFAALLAACSEDGAGPAVPEAIQILGGNGQEGTPGALLPQALQVKVVDAAGGAIAGFTVSFSTTGGFLSAQSRDTDDQGLAQTTLTLPNQVGQVTVTASGGGLTPVAFTAEAVPAPVELQTTFLPAARTTLPYSRRIVATGGAGNPTFSVEGALPAGLSLGSNGRFVGTATETGSFPIVVTASDAGQEASRAFTLNVCDVPAPIAVGEVQVLGPTARGACGIFLPTGVGGDRYRIAAVSPSTGTTGMSSTVLVRGHGVISAPPLAARRWSGASVGGAPPTAALGASAALRARRPTHLAQLRANLELLERFGRGTSGAARSAPPVLPGVALPDMMELDPTTPANCQAGNRVTAIKVAEDARMAVYQDAGQRQNPATTVSAEQAQRFLDYYRDFGKRVIDEFFGGLPDIDANGKVIVFVTPEIPEQVFGGVYTGDLLSPEECPASNGGEYLYIAFAVLEEIVTGDRELGYHVMVHELKHIASLYPRVLVAEEADDFHPLWEEEGGADLAGERAARLAWASRGGPAVIDAVGEAELRLGEDVDVQSDNLGVLAVLFGVQDYLSVQPNSVVTAPPGLSDIYLTASGWTFLRWLGDAHGDAGDAEFAEAGLFTALTDGNTPPGIPGIEAVTGRSWAELMAEYAAALMAGGQEVDVPRSFTSYELRSAIEMWCIAVDPFQLEQSGCTNEEPGPPGAFPWPVTTSASGDSESRDFGDGDYAGTVGPSGIRVHDLVSNGTGHGAEVNVEMPPTGIVVLVRIR